MTTPGDDTDASKGASQLDPGVADGPVRPPTHIWQEVAEIDTVRRHVHRLRAGEVYIIRRDTSSQKYGRAGNATHIAVWCDRL